MTTTNANNILSFAKPAVSSSVVDLTRIYDAQKKRQILNIFIRSYTGGMRAGFKTRAITSPSCSFLAGTSNQNEMGYLVNEVFKGNEDIRSFKYCSLAVVKAKYRGNGVLKQMLTNAIDDYGIEGIELTIDRAISLRNYYRQFGWTHMIQIGPGLVLLTSHRVFTNYNCVSQMTLPKAA